MTVWEQIDSTIRGALGDLRPVAVSFLDAPPAGVERFTGTVPSGCSFWRVAAAGRSFYTAPDDHFNCAIGSYTHHIDLPEARSGELGQTLSLMEGLGYIRMEEVPGIPRLATAPDVTTYAPLADAVVDPDVVIFAGRPSSLMRLQEAALRAGAASSLPLLGRPTCMALPASMAHGSVMSTGCIGNRVYTDLADDELYLMVPGPRLADVAAQVQTVAQANDALAQYHTDKRQAMQ